MNLTQEVKKKKEFSKLPDSIIKRALSESNQDVKEARSLLRKYFGVFLTNKVLKGKDEPLTNHMSSKKRDYKEFYLEIFKGIGDTQSIVDLGCGANGFSYNFLPNKIKYIGIEAAGQLVSQMNEYFKKNNFDAKAICLDIFEIKEILKILKGQKKPRTVFLFQVVDALENMERNFSKNLIGDIMKECENMVISLPLVSLGGRKKFAVQRKWLLDFLKENFVIKKDFEMFGERIIIIVK